MQNLNPTAAGFFRFPARMVFRSLRLVRAERVEGHAPNTLFRHRHTDVETVKMLTVTVKDAIPARVPAARITVRV